MKAQEIVNALADEANARQRQVVEINSQLHALIDKHNADERQRTIRGLRWEATGFIVITL